MMVPDLFNSLYKYYCVVLNEAERMVCRKSGKVVVVWNSGVYIPVAKNLASVSQAKEDRARAALHTYTRAHTHTHSH